MQKRKNLGVLSAGLVVPVAVFAALSPAQAQTEPGAAPSAAPGQAPGPPSSASATPAMPGPPEAAPAPSATAALPPVPAPPPTAEIAGAPAPLPPAPAQAETTPLPPAQPPPAAAALPPEPIRTAHVAMSVDHPEAWLELRSIMEEGPWKRACASPCNQRLMVDGMEARVAGPGMTTSNTFRIEPGPGTARIKVSSGSSTARTLGIAGLVIGTPVAMVGMGIYGFGRVDDKASLKAAGVVTLVVGAAMAVSSLPLLAIGSTTVRDGQGDMIAQQSFGPRL